MSVGDQPPMAVAAAVATAGFAPGTAEAEEGSRSQGQMDAAARLAVRQALAIAGGARYQAA